MTFEIMYDCILLALQILYAYRHNSLLTPDVICT
jgi:hypothetical protein